MTEQSSGDQTSWPRQQRVLELIYETFVAAAEWPTFQHVSSAIWDEIRVEGRDLYYALSASQFVVPAVNPQRGFNLRDDTRVQVSLRGMMYLPTTSDDVLRFMAAVRHVAERASAFRPSNPTEVESLQVSSEELRDALGLSPGDSAMLRLCSLFRDQAPLIRSSFYGPGEDGTWSFVVEVGRARRFRDVYTLPAFLEVEEAIRTEGSRPWSGPIGGEMADVEDEGV